MGPVSETLAVEIAIEMSSNPVVYLLDSEANYTAFIDGWASVAPYPVLAFRGSHLELMASLAKHANGVNATPLLVHLPGFNDETVRHSPFYEVCAAGKRMQKALATLVTDAAAGRALPDQISAYVKRQGLTLEDADAWLAGLDASNSGALGGLLQNMTIDAIVDDLLAGGSLASRMGEERDRSALKEHFARALGLNDAWRDEGDRRATPRPRDLAFLGVSWALAVEYTMDLSRPPVDERLCEIHKLPKAVHEACFRLAQHTRERHAAFYKDTATEAETWLADEKAMLRAEELGHIDTFAFEEATILSAALDALRDTKFKRAFDWAESRAAGESFWTRATPDRRNAWQLVRDAAKLGLAIEAAGPSLGHVTSLDAATERYVEHGAAVDRAHRSLIQQRESLLYPQVTEFHVLRPRLDEMHARWRAWADAWATDWNGVCQRSGFLPAADLQQRTLFDQVVRPIAADPLAPSDVTAYFVVDAFRFEMAEELADAIGEQPATKKQLRARLAELPTVTEVGMNVLAPVAVNGKLKPALRDNQIQGFSAGEYRVDSPETRRRAMFDRVGGAGCPRLPLRDVLTEDAASLRRRVAQSRLILVHSQEIDILGEDGVGIPLFYKVLQDLRAAWRLLREAGVRRFVFTADHGFLLLDDKLGDAQRHGRPRDPKRRYVLTEVAADHRGEVRVPLSQLGYEDTSAQLMMPLTVNVFDDGRGVPSFVHGGNSPQERVIPVLTLIHGRPAGRDEHTYTISARAGEGLAGMHCIEAQVDVTQGQMFGGKRSIELGLVVHDALPSATVELCQARRGAKVAGNVIQADIGVPFELFFRIVGATDARARVELRHTGTEAGDVRSTVLDERFSVTVAGGRAPSAEAPPSTTSWLAELPAGGVRQVFEHVEKHGAITETEAANMLGGARELRKFAREFEDFAKKAPFRVRIEVVAGVKRYVREGAAS
ncbi:MAG: BREX-6 system phosphatase PglZ [Deltaproteobacteria bacterium]|nr:BREX-6 system phosphatase PglZ [Deltaproteobacteria bacterium]